MKKRVLAALLVLILAVGLLPISAAASTLGQDIVDYAATWVGKTPYVYGGNSLTTGADCSGFICSVYEHFGINLWSRRTGLRGFVNDGLAVEIGTDLTQAQPGDIITCWGGGHVAIYAGNGQAVHALNSKHNTVKTPANASWLGTITSVIRLNAVSGGTSSGPSAGTTSKPEVSVNGREVTVSWDYTGEADAIDVYMLQSPWNWEDLKYATKVDGSKKSTSITVQPGFYAVFTVARPNADSVQSEWTTFTVGGDAPEASLRLNLAEIYTGQSVTLTHSVTNATSTSLDIYKDGNLLESRALSGSSTDYTCAETGDYTAKLVAKNANGQTTKTVKWTVLSSATDRPTVSVSGQNVTVNWTGANSDYRTVDVYLVEASSTLDSTTYYKQWADAQSGSHTFYGVEPGAYQACTVASLNGVDSQSDWSSWVYVGSEPATSGTCGYYYDTAGNKVSGSVTWSYNKTTKTLTISGKGNMDDFDQNGPWYNSGSSCEPWKAFIDEIKKVTIASGVEYIGDNAFYDCGALTEVSFSEGLLRIGDCTFYGCKNLKELSLPESLRTLGSYTFERCDGLTEVVIPDQTELGSDCFANCKGLVSANTGRGEWYYNHNPANNTIGLGAFENCTNLTRVTIEAPMSWYAFQNCTSLTEVEFVEPVIKKTWVDMYAFAGCTSLKEIVLPDYTLGIASSAFSGCTSLAKITIPESVTTIDATAFKNCPNLTIYGVPGSTAETYAAEHSIPFVDMNAPIPETYAVTYDANGGKGVPEAQTKTENVALTLSAVQPVKEGHTFTGWTTAADGSGAAYAPGGTYSANAAATLYAQWTPNAYTVAYNANGGAGTMSPTGHTYGAEKALAKNTFTKPGCTFAGWAMTPDGIGYFADGASVVDLTTQSGGTVTLYAVWEAAPVDTDSADVVLSLSGASVRPGGTVKLDLTVDEAAADFNTLGVTSLTYDPNVLTFLGFTDNGPLVTAAALPSVDSDLATVTLGYMTAEARTGKVCSLEFRAAETIAQPATTKVSMYSLVKNGSVELSSAVRGGTVTVADEKPGDIDGNDAVDIDDAIALLRYSMFPDTYPIGYKGAVDFNKDGSVDVDDAIAVLRYSMFPDLYPLG